MNPTSQNGCKCIEESSGCAATKTARCECGPGCACNPRCSCAQCRCARAK